MPRFSHAQLVGFAEDVCKVCEEERRNLLAAGIDPEKFAAPTRALLKQVVDRNATQEHLKRQLREETAAYRDAFARLYEAASGLLDTLMAAVGKNSDAAKIHRRIRSRIRAPGRQQAADAATPVPSEPGR